MRVFGWAYTQMRNESEVAQEVGRVSACRTRRTIGRSRHGLGLIEPSGSMHVGTRKMVNYA